MSGLQRTRILVVLIVLLAPVVPATATAAPGPTGGSPGDEQVLLGYARDTWNSMAAMANPAHRPGRRQHPLRRPERPAHLHLTDEIGGYLWSAVVADLRIITRKEARARRQTLRTLATLDTRTHRHVLQLVRHARRRGSWCGRTDGSPVHPFLSNRRQRLACGLPACRRGRGPRLADQATLLLEHGLRLLPRPGRHHRGNTD